MTEPWLLFGLGCGAVLVHLAAYLIWARDWRSLKSERGIFLYHFVPFAALALAAIAFCAGSPDDQILGAALAALSLHAIYSMSFLELWSLSQISYSIAILDAIERQPGADPGTVTARFTETGQAKKASRLQGLEKLGMIRRQEGRMELAPRGRLAASVLLVLRFIANLKHTG
jgi:hypothetical protein